ncbi:hypothetical protein EDD37DRAFT_125508 [Exophiala viscosa]|uniref:BTB domain-containing protein n=1 Tax=Exophiala viscosa TaxID=2486360 RepID=A0AAN6DX95_9EURO|nr:hypothetical protein EDD36DRAFT_221588 [Exophiala viscosa]KAI1621625.1 hypothetical protein EDD37DRAFT_125508 [Exophiala viscosa]
MEDEDSDLTTFVSQLNRQQQPDFTIAVRDYSWKVHSRKLARSSSFFQKICNGEPQDIANNSVTLDNEDPIIIGYLILWLYTGKYGARGLEETQLSIEKIMTSGRTSPSECSDLFIPESGDEFDQPDSLHAQIYLVADEYGIEELKELAVSEIEYQFGWDSAAFLPSLTHLLLRPAAAPAIATPENSNNGGNSAARPKRTICEIQDADLWAVLVKMASDKFSLYRADKVMKEVALANPEFQWAILSKIADKSEQQQAELDKAQKVDTPPAPKKRKYTKPKAQPQTHTPTPSPEKEKEKGKPKAQAQVQTQAQA